MRRGEKILQLQLANNAKYGVLDFDTDNNISSETSTIEANSMITSLNSTTSDPGYIEVDTQFFNNNVDREAVKSGINENDTQVQVQKTEHILRSSSLRTRKDPKLSDFLDEDVYTDESAIDCYDDDPDYFPQEEVSIPSEGEQYNSYGNENDVCFNKREYSRTGQLRNKGKNNNKSVENYISDNKMLEKRQLPNEVYIPIVEKIDIDYRSLKIDISGKSKKHFCFYCSKLQTKFARHLELKHANEQEVTEFLLLPKKDAHRLALITAQRNKGDFLYNSQSVFNKGNVIVVRRPRDQKQNIPSQYRPCGKCGAMYSKLSLSVHYRRCQISSVKGKKDVLPSSRLKSYIHPKANFIMKNKILPHLRDDNVNILIHTQESIILFGNRLTHKYRSPHLYKMIRARLRCVAKFFMYFFRKYQPDIHNFEEVFNSVMYDNVIKAINDLAGLNEETGKYKAPSTAGTIASYLKKISLHLVAEMIKTKNEQKLVDIRNFHQLLQEGLPYDIYKTVAENQLEQKRNKVVELPSSQDINCLRDYLDYNIEKFMNHLSKSYSFEVWKELASLVLISLQLFNRRRAGEIARIKIDDFLKYESVPDGMKQQNKKLKYYVRFLIRGKKGRGVPVMIHIKKLKALRMILKYRNLAGVSKNNPYLFGISGNDNYGHLEAERLIRKFSQECGAFKPHTLRGTELRKHLATKCADWDLGDVKIKDIAEFMGHHEKIHMEHYRLPNATRDISRISAILEKAQNEDNNGNNSSMEICSISDKSDKTTPKRLSWTSEEKKIIEEKAKFYLENLESIPLDFCNALVEQNPVLRRRSGRTVKAFVANEITKIKKNVLVGNPVSQKGNIQFGSFLFERSNRNFQNYINHLKFSGVRRYWSDRERRTIQKIFMENISQKRLPSIPFCKKVIETNNILKGRTPSMVKAFINNLIRKP